ncbi:hypothetical protein [Streptomyces sp. NPDC001985]|uniref:hypothetical protein n=1 Tax=Streptomyces sp. NPDC001985 TaxID=3154406 RepID=UPI00331DB357
MDIGKLMEFLADHRAPNLPPGYLSEQLLSMSWIITPEDSGMIFTVGRKWLESGDEFRVAVALGLKEAFLAESWDEHVELADSVRSRLPSLAPEVDHWLRYYSRSFDTPEARAIRDEKKE